MVGGSLEEKLPTEGQEPDQASVTFWPLLVGGKSWVTSALEQTHNSQGPLLCQPDSHM